MDMNWQTGTQWRNSFPDPAKLVQLLERVHEDRGTGSSALIEETYAGDFSGLLRVGGGNAKRKEQSAKSKECDFFLHIFFSVSIHLSLHT
jgi:hypothetical protein